MAVFFLDYPKYGIGDDRTWLFTAQQGGFFRTADAGATWSQVYDKQMTHGGNQIYCSSAAVLYSGGYQYPVRSTDGGKTWAQVNFSTEPFEMAYDSANGIVYSSNWGGLYALKVDPKDTGILPGEADAHAGRRTVPGLTRWRGGMAARAASGKRYSLPGRRLRITP